MTDPYPIVEVRPEWVLEPEEMGSKTKFWYRDPEGSQRDWLFKYPQPDTGQHWAEKIAEQVASILGISHARVELAEFQGNRGSVTKSFAWGDRTLYHGNQLLERVIHDYDPGKKFHQSSHTLANIWRVMKTVFVATERVMSAKTRIAEYMVLDALIGNTDRHHENWGVIRTWESGGWKSSVAPSFDHASSLGRELRDSRRDRYMAEDRVGGYVERGHGAIYWSREDPRGLGPLELVRRGARDYPDVFQPALAKITALNEGFANDIVNRTPGEWMTTSAREFAIVLLRYDLEQLRKLVR